MTYDVAVRTEIWRSDGTLFFDMGTMRWPGVDEDIIGWLAGSCKTTAFWLVCLPESAEQESYTLKYQTVVTREDGSLHSDTTELAFERMTYADVIRFERWAIEQLREMCDLFESRHKGTAKTRKRNKVRQLAKWAFQMARAKCAF